MKWPDRNITEMEAELAAARARLAGTIDVEDLGEMVRHWDADPAHAQHCVDDVRGLVAVLQDDRTRTVRAAHWDRADVYRAIDAEREHQAQKYGADRCLSLPGFLLVIELELAEAKLACVKGGDGRHSALAELVQVAATAVAALEKYGIEGCPAPTDDFLPRGIVVAGTERDHG